MKMLFVKNKIASNTAEITMLIIRALVTKWYTFLLSLCTMCSAVCLLTVTGSPEFKAVAKTMNMDIAMV